MRPMLNPDWFKRLPDNAQVKSAEVAQLFGYSPNTNASVLLKHKSIPKPTHNCSGFSRNKNFGWEVKYLRTFLNNDNP